jgi:hypothetical protein
MALGALNSASLVSARLTATRVQLGRNGFQVIRIDAAPVPAEVIELQAFGDRTDEVFVRPPVGTDRSTADTEGAVTVDS